MTDPHMTTKRITPGRRAAGIGLVMLFLSSCAGDGAPVTGTTAPAVASSSGGAASPDGSVVIDSPAPAAHQTSTTAGHYLAARQALYFNDVIQSADFFLDTLETAADSVPILRQAFLTQYYYGDIERAAALGRQLESLDVIMPLGGEPGTALAIKNGDWAATVVLADRIAEDGSSQVMAGLIRGWALVADGRGDAGISALLEAGRLATTADGAVPAYIRLNAALMAEHVGLANEAMQRVSGLEDRLTSAQLMLQLAAFHARMGNAEAVERIISSRLSGQFNDRHVRAALEKQAKALPDLRRVIANAVVAMALHDRENDTGRSISARLRFSIFIDPENEFSRFLLAQQMADLGQYDAAIADLARIPPTGIYGQLARLLESSVVEDKGDIDAAIGALRLVVETNPENADLHQRLGDLYRRHKMFRQSRDAYMQALDLGSNSGGLHRSIGVALERLGEAKAAEAHLLEAIEINPDDAYALNYLGYWWADDGRNLDQAIAMIEHAVDTRPDSGFFVDSLGWVHYRLGDPQKAVGYLERATELEPADPEITGHLGDAYWALGRHDEARFKWRLALSLSEDAEERAMLEGRLADGVPEADMPGAK